MEINLISDTVTKPCKNMLDFMLQSKVGDDVFKEDPKIVEECLVKAFENKDNSRSLYFYTSRLNKSYSDEQKIQLIEVLWEIILSDNELHDFETNLIRRLAGLLYISDVECGNAKIRAENKGKQ